MKLLEIWRHFVDVWFHVGAHSILKGSPKRQFSIRCNIKLENKGVQEGVKKREGFYDGFVMSKWKALISQNKHFALYLLQNMSFLGIVKYRES